MLSQQRYNHLKPEKKWAEARISAEKKVWARKWIYFAARTVILDKRAVLSGRRQGRLSQSDKLQRQVEIIRLLKRRTEGKNTAAEESRLRWLVEGCSLKHLTQIVRIVGYEEFKANMGTL